MSKQNTTIIMNTNLSWKIQKTPSCISTICEITQLRISAFMQKFACTFLHSMAKLINVEVTQCKTPPDVCVHIYTATVLGGDYA